MGVVRGRVEVRVRVSDEVRVRTEGLFLKSQARVISKAIPPFSPQILRQFFCPLMWTPLWLDVSMGVLNDGHELFWGVKFQVKTGLGSAGWLLVFYEWHYALAVKLFS